MLLDAHFHLWDPASQPHAWLAALPALDRRFAARDYEQVALPSGVRSGVLVQALADASETEELLAIAATGLDDVAVGAEGDHLDRIVGAVLGQVVDVVDLEDRVSSIR